MGGHRYNDGCMCPRCAEARRRHSWHVGLLIFYLVAIVIAIFMVLGMIF